MTVSNVADAKISGNGELGRALEEIPKRSRNVHYGRRLSGTYIDRMEPLQRLGQRQLNRVDSVCRMDEVPTLTSILENVDWQTLAETVRKY